MYTRYKYTNSLQTAGFLQQKRNVVYFSLLTLLWVPAKPYKTVLNKDSVSDQQRYSDPSVYISPAPGEITEDPPLSLGDCSPRWALVHTPFTHTGRHRVGGASPCGRGFTGWAGHHRVAGVKLYEGEWVWRRFLPHGAAPCDPGGHLAHFPPQKKKRVGVGMSGYLRLGEGHQTGITFLKLSTNDWNKQHFVCVTTTRELSSSTWALKHF